MTVATDYLDYSTLAQGIGFVVVNVGASHLFSHPIIGKLLTHVAQMSATQSNVTQFTRRTKLDKIQGGLYRASQDLRKGGLQ